MKIVDVVFWWEEPTTRQREQPTADVAARTTGRVATGENCHTVGQFLTLDRQTGRLSLPDAPGLGIDLDLDVARAYPYDPRAYLDVVDPCASSRR